MPAKRKLSAQAASNTTFAGGASSGSGQSAESGEPAAKRVAVVASGAGALALCTPAENNSPMELHPSDDPHQCDLPLDTPVPSTLPRLSIPKGMDAEYVRSLESVVGNLDSACALLILRLLSALLRDYTNVKITAKNGTKISTNPGHLQVVVPVVSSEMGPAGETVALLRGEVRAYAKPVKASHAKLTILPFTSDAIPLEGAFLVAWSNLVLACQSSMAIKLSVLAARKISNPAAFTMHCNMFERTNPGFNPSATEPAGLCDLIALATTQVENEYPLLRDANNELVQHLASVVIDLIRARRAGADMPLHEMHAIRTKAADTTQISRLYLNGKSVFGFRPDVPAAGDRPVPPGFTLKPYVPSDYAVDAEVPADRWHTPHQVTLADGTAAPTPSFTDAASFVTAALSYRDPIAGDGPSIVSMRLGITGYTMPKIGARVDAGPIRVAFRVPQPAVPPALPPLGAATMAMFGVPAIKAYADDADV
jgi:hypothetical protein